jgi:uncharacterized protein (DUF302 family)
MTQSTFTTTHVRTSTAKGFAEVMKEFESRLGKFDPARLRSKLAARASTDEVRSAIEAQAGSSGFMLFGTIDHGELLTLFAEPRKAIQYVVGNPLIALQMIRRNVGAGLYAPLRVLVYEEDGKTIVECDKPSSLFGQFQDPEIFAVGSGLDAKLEALVAAAIR